MSELTEFRKQKDEYFKNDPHSPLTPEQRVNFEGLKYYPENKALDFELKIDLFEEQDTIQMQTSTGDIQTYTRYGKIHFEVDGEDTELTVYQSLHGFFIPFVDANAGKLTYGAGRYLDPPPLPGDQILVDFNQAYNPYCAYNDRYSCPIPPAENRLSVAIEAGEKNYK